MNAKESKYVIGVDIGGTSISCALVNSQGHIRRGSLYQCPVDSKAPAESILSVFAQPLISDLQQATNDALSVVGIGVGMCGPLDYENGICMISGVDKYEAIFGVNLREELKNRLNLKNDFPIVFDIDAWAFARGEAWLGAGKSYNRILALTLGTGLGSGFVVDGKMLSDGPGIPPPMAGSGGLPHGKGTLDDMISKRGILALYNDLAIRPLKKSMDVEDVAQGARNGDPACKEVFRLFGKRLGKALKPILLEFKAECLILGGRISKSFDLFEKPLREQLSDLPELPEISKAHSISSAAILGAAHLAFQEINSH